jgi:ABC-type transporter MlaC component
MERRGFPASAAVLLAIVMLACAACRASSAYADPGPATAHVQRFLAEGERAAQAIDREAQLEGLLDRDFDVALIARTALGPAYARMSDEERNAYVALFREQAVLAMERAVVLARVEEVVIIEARDLAAPESMIVTRMVDAQGRVQLSCWRIRSAAGWTKIVDVVTDGVSLARGEELRAILLRSGGEAGALLTALRAQNAEMRA